MVILNLLPWRAQRRHRRRRHTLLALGLSLLCGWFGWWRLDSRVHDQLRMQQQHTRALEQQLAEHQAAEEAQKQQQRQSYLQTEAIACLNHLRLSTLHLFSTLASALPDGVVLSHVQQHGRRLSVDGRMTSGTDLAAWLSRLHAHTGEVLTLTLLESLEDQGYRFQWSLQPVDDTTETDEVPCPQKRETGHE